MALDFNPYKVLKVDPTADSEIVTAAYRALSKKYHPDTNKSPDAQGRMQQINRAYDMLKDATERAKVDAELARAASTSTSSTSSSSTSNSYSSSSSNRYNPSPTSSYTSSRPSSYTSTNNPFSRWEKWRTTQSNRQAETKVPEDDEYYLYQKRLVDDVKKKVFRVSVYHDRVMGGKVCSIFCSANRNGTLNSGAVYLKSPELFDLINDLEDAVQHIEASGQPIEMLSDHDVFFRRSVTGLNNTFIGIEIIKPSRESTKEGLFLIGEKGKSNGGVVSDQTPKQLAQIERILKEALSAMR